MKKNHVTYERLQINKKTPIATYNKKHILLYAFNFNLEVFLMVFCTTDDKFILLSVSHSFTQPIKIMDITHTQTGLIIYIYLNILLFGIKNG